MFALFKTASLFTFITNAINLNLFGNKMLLTHITYSSMFKISFSLIILQKGVRG